MATSIEVDSKAFGRIAIEDRQLVRFPAGLFGFPELTEYALIDAARPPFYWLQSTEVQQTAFVVLNPYEVTPNYVLDIPPADLEAIEDPPAEDLVVFAIVTIPNDRTRMSINLQGPVIINRYSRVGRQAISLDPRWRTRHFLFPGQET